MLARLNFLNSPPQPTRAITSVGEFSVGTGV